MSVILPPTPGEDVRVLAPHTRLRGHVTGRGPEALTIELEKTVIRRPFRFPAGLEMELEWVHSSGVVQQTVRVAEAREAPAPTIDVQLVGAAESVERREHERSPVELEVSAWSIAQPTRRLIGHTVDLSPGGALLWLPELASHAFSLQLSVALPSGILHATAEVCWRREGDFVGVEFQRVAPEEQVRLVDFLRQPR